MTEPKITFKNGATIGEVYGPAMEVQTEDEAREYFDAIVNHLIEIRSAEQVNTPREYTEEIVRQNLGYYAGYYDDETRERVERLYKTWHPIFGANAHFPPSVEEKIRTSDDLEFLRSEAMNNLQSRLLVEDHNEQISDALRYLIRKLRKTHFGSRLLDNEEPDAELIAHKWVFDSFREESDQNSNGS